MADTFKYVFLSLVRNKGILIWALAFPIVLSCCFMVMFQGLDQLAQTEPTRVVVVQDEAYDDSDAFRQFVDAASEGADSLLSATFADTPEEAERLVNESANEDRPYAGYVTVGTDGMPTVHLLPEDGSASSGVNNVYQAILVRVMDVFCSKSHMIRELLAKDPLFLADPSNVESVFQVSGVTQKTSLTENAPRESVRYYFALLGMAAMFAAQGSLLAVGALLPNASPLGARRALGGISRIRALLGCILASWLVSFGCLAVAYLFIRYAAGVDFGNRDLPCLGVLAVSSLMSVGMGALIGSIPKGSIGAKAGILAGIACFASLFAGLYGEPTMDLADSVAAAFPASQYINPAVQISQAMFSLMYYESLAPCLQHVLVLLAMTVVFFLASARFLGRQRYASL